MHRKASKERQRLSCQDSSHWVCDLSAQAGPQCPTSAHSDRPQHADLVRKARAVQSHQEEQE
eukprot:655361-Amphidinium_carterae.1